MYSRVDTVAVGKLSLNLSGFSKESVSVFGTQLSSAIKNLLPFTHYVPLTVGYLNSASLGPKKDYETNRYINFLFVIANVVDSLFVALVNPIKFKYRFYNCTFLLQDNYWCSTAS